MSVFRTATISSLILKNNSIIGLKLRDRNRLKDFVSISIDDICEGFTMKKERIKVHYDGEAKGWNKAVDKINKIIKKLKQ